MMEKNFQEEVEEVFEVPAKVTDMQFATFWIIWRDTFQESKKIPLKGSTIQMELDSVKTAAANK